MESASADPPPETASAASLIDHVRSRFVDSLARGDVREACGVYTADAQLLPPSAPPVDGRPDIAAFWQAGIDAGIRGVELEAVNLRRGEGLAYEIGRYTLRLQPSDSGDIVVDRGYYVHIHERQGDGSWLRAVEIFTPESAGRG